MTATLEITPETERRLKMAAEASRVPVETTINAALDALEAKLATQTTRRKPTREDKLDAIDKAVAAIKALPVLDPRTPDEILGYDEFGLPSRSWWIRRL